LEGQWCYWSTRELIERSINSRVDQ
jgi:hypothetical protein